MAIKSFLQKQFFGTNIPQEYICLAEEKLKQPFRIFLEVDEGNIKREITDQHLFLGYSPVIIGLIFDNDDQIIQQINSSSIISIKFNINDDNHFELSKNKANNPAQLVIKTLTTKDFGSKSIILCQAISGKHHFISTFQKFNNKVKSKLRKNIPGNVSLLGNLYEQVRIAYSVPRRISIISLGNGAELYNMFPTDLHGPLNEELYIISLRYNGKACKQVEECKKITLSSINLSFCKEAYSSGKNHMKELQAKEAFPNYPEKSAHWQNLLPAGVLSYIELEKINTEETPLIFGIHQLHFFRVIQRHNITRKNEDAATLSHIHNFYLQWRMNKGLETEYLLR